MIDKKMARPKMVCFSSGGDPLIFVNAPWLLRVAVCLNREFSLQRQNKNSQLAIQERDYEGVKQMMAQFLPLKTHFYYLFQLKFNSILPLILNEQVVIIIGNKQRVKTEIATTSQITQGRAKRIKIFAIFWTVKFYIMAQNNSLEALRQFCFFRVDQGQGGKTNELLSEVASFICVSENDHIGIYRNGPKIILQTSNKCKEKICFSLGGDTKKKANWRSDSKTFVC